MCSAPVYNLTGIQSRYVVQRSSYLPSSGRNGYTSRHAPLAQLVRAFDSHSKGRRFESCKVHKTSVRSFVHLRKVPAHLPAGFEKVEYIFEPVLR